jgi:nucleoside-diphosphate-sugar epimerase
MFLMLLTMRINILGGTGLVGHGIYNMLEKEYQVKVFSSDCFDFDLFCFRSDDIFDCDMFIHAAGVKDEEVAGNMDFGLKKSTKFIDLIIVGLKSFSCSKLVYISTVHVFGDLSLEINPNRLPNPKSFYSFFHYCTEKVLELRMNSLSRDFKLLLLRVPTIYGFQENMNKINRPSIIQNSFLTSLLENGSINLRSDGRQFRLFASNYKVGGIIKVWLMDNNKKCITTETVNGENWTVHNFALLCLKRISILVSDRDFHLNRLNQTALNDTLIPISVNTKYDFVEPYPLEKYIDDFLNFRLNLC